jgi:c-di-GMP-binding flagellar brake protein YcgR
MPEGSMYIEKRKFKRVEKEYAVRYKLMPKDNAMEAMKKDGAGKDISIGGIRIEGDPVGLINDVVRIEFIIEGVEDPVTTFAEIKWIRDVKGSMQFGVEFLALKETDKAALERVINA